MRETRLWSEPAGANALEGFGNFRALLIGIDKYRDRRISPLSTAVNDVKEMQKILETRYGFGKTFFLLNEQATKKAIDDAFRRLIQEQGPNDSTLIYYAGHGELDRLTGDGWWVPADAKWDDFTTYVDNAIIQKYIRAMKARHVLLISDSCYSGILLGEGRSLARPAEENFYRELQKSRSRWGMTSGNKTPVADGGSGGHSIFAYHLLRALEGNQRSFITPREIYAAIGPVIRNNSEQMPLCLPLKNSGDEGGEFVLANRASMVRSDPARGFKINCYYRSPDLGEVRPLLAGSILRTGDRYKINFTPARDGFVYIFRKDAAEEITSLFPLPESEGPARGYQNPVRKDREYALPARDEAYDLGEHPGKEALYFLSFDREPVELENVVSALAAAHGTGDRAREVDARAKLTGQLERRQANVKTSKRASQVVWGDRSETFTLFPQEVEDLGEDTLYRLDFVHHPVSQSEAAARLAMKVDDYKTLINRLLRTEKYQEALRAMDEALSKFPGNSDLALFVPETKARLNSLKMRSLQDGTRFFTSEVPAELGLALRGWETVIRIDPKNQDAQGKVREMRERIDELIRQRARMAQECLERGEIIDARDLALEILAMDDRRTEGRDLIEKVKEEWRKYLESKIAESQSCYQRGRFQESIEILKFLTKSLENQTDIAQAYMYLGYAYGAMGASGDAAKSFANACMLDPQVEVSAQISPAVRELFQQARQGAKGTP